jgi:hypothetical protein
MWSGNVTKMVQILEKLHQIGVLQSELVLDKLIATVHSKGAQTRPIELTVIDLLLRVENEKSKQFITLFNQKDAPVVVRPPREDRMQVDEGA